MYKKFFLCRKVYIMDAKITLSFNKSVIERAKEYADKNNISVSRLTKN